MQRGLGVQGCVCVQGGCVEGAGEGGGLGDRWKYSKVQGPQKEREKGNKI